MVALHELSQWELGVGKEDELVRVCVRACVRVCVWCVCVCGVCVCVCVNGVFE